MDWESVRRARAVAFACRTVRQLDVVTAGAAKPESRLAADWRETLFAAVAADGGTDELLAVVEAIHARLAYLPQPTLPTGMRVFLREMFGQQWDEQVVVAAVADARWPGAGEAPVAHVDDGGAAPITVIPRAELYNPLMWPLVALQGAAIVGWDEAEERVADLAGPGLFFARAEARSSADADDARALWKRGRDELAADEGAYDAARELAASLADGVMISARRRGEKLPDGGVYGELAAVRDEPARAADILSAGWLHWYSHDAPQLLALDAALRDDAAPHHETWAHMRVLVNGLDDVLCRSLDVAAVHRFYATEGAMT